jgi:hypothetical protein
MKEFLQFLFSSDFLLVSKPLSNRGLIFSVNYFDKHPGLLKLISDKGNSS